MIWKIRTLSPMMFGLVFALGLAAGCTLTMRNQPHIEPFEASAFFADGASARPAVPDTVARSQQPGDELLTTGRVNGGLAQTFPFTITQAILLRGQERFNIFCTPCHGLLGDGHGVVAEYGMEAPSFHDPELRADPPGYYFSIITDGTRVMPSYGARIAPADRWAIIAYIRALQLSQDADAAQLSPEDLAKLGQ